MWRVATAATNPEGVCAAVEAVTRTFFTRYSTEQHLDSRAKGYLAALSSHVEDLPPIVILRFASEPAARD